MSKKTGKAKGCQHPNWVDVYPSDRIGHPLMVVCVRCCARGYKKHPKDLHYEWKAPNHEK